MKLNMKLDETFSIFILNSSDLFQTTTIAAELDTTIHQIFLTLSASFKPKKKIITIKLRLIASSRNLKRLTQSKTFTRSRMKINVEILQINDFSLKMI